MRAGELTERITVEAKTIIRDGGGGYYEEWAPFATLRAKIIHQKGEESFVAARTQAKVTVKFKTRFQPGITPSHRIQWRDKTFDIYDVDDTRRRDDELWITATAKS
ncbi:phage head closure protein [Salinisphaera orenii]|uniref:Head-tail adaptor protein n=1 Tax=Salinisphaera orenii YIM 95161 TaxID=1051139 RepID=A0A423PMC9_9GAMM|nr:phage head closure protein [Salinisphaera halophila]ROO26692.1 head-tail adaptor protein [Salinisphaera halophila YIM 95161]